MTNWLTMDGTRFGQRQQTEALFAAPDALGTPDLFADADAGQDEQTDTED